MENYGSPTIEQTGGRGNEIEPQTVVLILILVVGIVVTEYISAAIYATALETVVAIHAAVFYRNIRCN